MAAGNERGMRQAVGVGWWVGGMGGVFFLFICEFMIERRGEEREIGEYWNMDE